MTNLSAASIGQPALHYEIVIVLDPDRGRNGGAPKIPQKYRYFLGPGPSFSGPVQILVQPANPARSIIRTRLALPICRRRRNCRNCEKKAVSNYWITSSARVSSLSDNVSPSALA